ncbi:4a-hydroxytetrahydrobiopterin dehydratase [Frankia sp. R82]|uniref:4a-hydroxytetrahydrobiopterin dehydratase n=1 Tax=Frankia sp. R82 TaxID=2950553 RepID=UPI0020441A7F|nr:4a-hydroxytetrahydrobiopterin dehydratase [Frankia sp. R82]MCM3883449.1 4a-hydroxytetrahydrobiopterin dehydratase [Frankia sp. R82]
MPTKPTKLDDSEVAAALSALPGWLGDADRIQLEILVDSDEADAISAEVLRAADELDHHPVIDRGPGTVTFTVWTHSVGGVTDLDITLARRISHLLSSAGIAY